MNVKAFLIIYAIIAGPLIGLMLIIQVGIFLVAKDLFFGMDSFAAVLVTSGLLAVPAYLSDKKVLAKRAKQGNHRRSKAG